MDFLLTLLSWTLILSYTTIYFFVKKFIFSNVYISVNTIFECLNVFFGWEERGHQLSAYAAVGEMKGHPKCVQWGERCHTSCVPTYLHYLFSCFWQLFLSNSVLFYLWKFNLNFIQKDVLSETVIFLQRDQFLSSWNKLFLLNHICEAKLDKTLLILIKQNLMYALCFSMIPYFKKTLCSV